MNGQLVRTLAWLLLLVAPPSFATIADIKANGVDGPLQIAQGQEIRIAVRLEPDGALKSQSSDWWLAALAGGSVFYYSIAGGWSTSPTPVIQAAGIRVPLTEVLTLPPLPVGSYTLVFGIDDDANGIPTPVAYDSVQIEVREPNQLPPRAGALVQVAASATLGSARLTWLAASDESTPPSQMRYAVHVGDSADFSPASATLKASLVGSTETELTALPTGKPLYALVIAQDRDGNDSSARDTLPFTLPSTPTTLASGTALNDAQSLGLSNATRTDANLSVPKTASTQSPVVGSILSGVDASGTPYLAKVTSVSDTGSNLLIQTTPAPLAAVYASAAFSSTLKLDDLSNTTANTAAMATPGVRNVRSGSVVLSAGAVSARPGAQLRDTSATASVTLQTNLAFAPSLTYDFLWHGGGWGLSPSIDKAEIVLIGDFKAETRFAFNFNAAANYEKEFDITIPNLFPRKFQTRMFVGNVPVLVDVEMTLKGKVSASAKSAIDASGVANYQRKISLGLRYDPDKRAWLYTPYTEFNRELTVSLSAQGEVLGELRLIPNVEARFNKILAIGASIEPFLSANATLEAVAGANLLTGGVVAYTQPKVFDVALNAECNAYVNLDMLVTTIPLLSGTVCGPYTYPLFSLPTLELATSAGSTAEIGKAYAMTFTTTDGTNDPVSARSLKFEVYPADKRASIKAVSTSSPQAGKTLTQLEFTPCEAADYTIYASAYGKLGEIGRQYQAKSVPASGSGSCDPVPSMKVTPRSGTPPLTVTLDASGSTAPQPITRYVWTASDGQRVEGMLASMRFSSKGAHTITLTIATDSGLSAQTQQEVLVYDSCLYDSTGLDFYRARCDYYSKDQASYTAKDNLGGTHARTETEWWNSPSSAFRQDMLFYSPYRWVSVAGGQGGSNRMVARWTRKWNADGSLQSYSKMVRFRPGASQASLPMGAEGLMAYMNSWRVEDVGLTHDRTTYSAELVDDYYYKSVIVSQRDESMGEGDVATCLAYSWLTCRYIATDTERTGWKFNGAEYIQSCAWNPGRQTGTESMCHGPRLPPLPPDAYSARPIADRSQWSGW